MSEAVPTVEAMEAALPLPSHLPTELTLSINRVLGSQRTTSKAVDVNGANATSTAATINAAAQDQNETSSLTTQLANLFPSADDLTPTFIEMRQAQIRQNLALQESRIKELLARLIERQEAIRKKSEAQIGENEEAGRQRQAETYAMEDQVQELLEQLATIREKAKRSEEIVRDITRDIRMLDTCKRNVVNSMTALKRLQMLVNAVAQLERLTKANRFREAASALSAVNSLLSSFKGFASVERVASVQNEVASLQKDLRDKARAEFESYFGQDSNRPLRSTPVPDAALVIDALGVEARSSLIDFYTTFQLREYRRIFRATDEAGQLDNVARRFAWFRRILKLYDDEYAAVFEEGQIKKWQVSRELTRKFAEITRQDIRSVLIRTQGKINVSVLLEALSATLEFESAMSKRFHIPFHQISSAPVAASSGSPIHLPATASNASAGQQTTLSTVFDPYLGLFVESQDRALSEMLQTFRRQGMRASLDEKETNSGNHQHTVLPSSTELFYFYGTVLEQCGRLSTREPFRDLCNVYKKHLQAYADEVLKPCLHRNEPVRRSGDTRSSIADLQRFCMVINTADYCATTSKQLEDKLREKIDAEFRQAVDLEPERDVFLAIVSAGVQGLARELEISVEPSFQQMLRVQWSTLNEDELDVKSAYVDEFAGALEHVAVVVRQDVQGKRYVRSWCDKAVGLVLAHFMFNIVRLKPVSRLSAKQLETDLAEFRLCLLELPRYSLSDEGSTSAASSYNRYVSKGVRRIETLLKLIASPDDDTDALVDLYVKLVGDRSFSNFQKVLDLKGIRKAQQNTLMDAFVSKVSQNDALEESSFLTTLDMDASSDTGGLGVADANTHAAPSSGSGLLSFMSSVGSIDAVGLSTPPLGSTPRYAAALGLGSSTPGNGTSTPTSGRGGKTSLQGDAVGAGAQRAFSDLRRFGSMLVGRRDAPSEERTR